MSVLTSDIVCYSLFAAEALESRNCDSSSASIYGCDESSVMSQTAVDIVSHSQFSRLIQIINKNSTELQCPNDFPTKLVRPCVETKKIAVNCDIL